MWDHSSWWLAAVPEDGHPCPPCLLSAWGIPHTQWCRYWHEHCIGFADIFPGLPDSRTWPAHLYFNVKSNFNCSFFSYLSVFSLSVLHGDFNGENVNIQSSLISSIWSDLEISSYAHWVSLKKKLVALVALMALVNLVALMALVALLALEVLVVVFVPFASFS